MKRRTGLKRKRATPRRISRVLDPGYLADVRTLPCAVSQLSKEPWFECDGPRDAHHCGARGLGQKCSDRETCCLCRKHHDAWHSGSGIFKGWTREDYRTQAAIWVELTLAQVLVIRAKRALRGAA